MDELTKNMSMIEKFQLGAKLKALTEDDKEQMKKGIKKIFEDLNCKKQIKKANHDDQGKFYAYMCQATRGECTEKEPCKIKVIKHKKWKLWHELKDMDKKEAMNKWVHTAKDIFTANLWEDLQKEMIALIKTIGVEK